MRAGWICCTDKALIVMDNDVRHGCLRREEQCERGDQIEAIVFNRSSTLETRRNVTFARRADKANTTGVIVIEARRIDYAARLLDLVECDSRRQ